MIPWVFSDGEAPAKTYKDFQGFPTNVREEALKWLRGRTDPIDIMVELRQVFSAANDAWYPGTADLVGNHAFVMMLYCWVENGRDDVRAKLAYVEGRQYLPLS